MKAITRALEVQVLNITSQLLLQEPKLQLGSKRHVSQLVSFHYNSAMCACVFLRDCGLSPQVPGSVIVYAHAMKHICKTDSSLLGVMIPVLWYKIFMKGCLEESAWVGQRPTAAHNGGIAHGRSLC
jgi:hypothetical protein